MDKEQYRCDLCGKFFSTEEIYAVYPEDDSILCKECFGNEWSKMEPPGTKDSTSTCQKTEI